MLPLDCPKPRPAARATRRVVSRNRRFVSEGHVGLLLCGVFGKTDTIGKYIGRHMPLTSYPLNEAAKLVACSYNPADNPSFDAQVKDRKGGDSRAYLLNNDFLIIPGSDSFADYAKYNFRIAGIGRKKLKISTKTKKGESGTKWHQGFLKHAQEIQTWLGNRRPTLIIGHSLGAASTQILSMTYKVSGIAFASPRTHTGSNSGPNSKYCLSICRTDDPVCKVPSSFNHMGRVIYLKHKDDRGLVRHNPWQYMKVLKKNTTPNKVPARWKS